jgi:hypothetical protein
VPAMSADPEASPDDVAETPAAGDGEAPLDPEAEAAADAAAEAELAQLEADAAAGVVPPATEAELAAEAELAELEAELAAETDEPSDAATSATPAGGSPYEDEPVLAFEPRAGRSTASSDDESAVSSGTDGDVVADDAEDRRAP